MNISNAEKQARFRKKEELKRGADKVFKETQQGLNLSPISPEEVLQFLNEAIQLPSGWTDQDYELAKRKIEQFRLDVRSSEDTINNDVTAALVVNNISATRPRGANLVSETRAAVDDAHALAEHIKSALRLSNCSDIEQSAALMEVVRLVGRSLANQAIVPRSHATAMCLATIGIHYTRPEWFAEEIAKALSFKIGGGLSREVAEQLTNPDLRVFP